MHWLYAVLSTCHGNCEVRTCNAAFVAYMGMPHHPHQQLVDTASRTLCALLSLRTLLPWMCRLT